MREFSTHFDIAYICDVRIKLYHSNISDAMETTRFPLETSKLDGFDNDDENTSAKSFFKQYYATFCLDLLAFIHGIFCGNENSF